MLTREQREFACRAMVDALLEISVDVIAFCVGAKHWHGLLRFRDPVKHRGQNRDAQLLVGRAKGKSAREMSRARIAPKGGIWASRCRARPVKNRSHQLSIAKYIRAHAKKGAAVIMLPLAPAKPEASAPGRNR